jgi:hypothetical protein
MSESILNGPPSSLEKLIYSFGDRVCPIYTLDRNGSPFLVGTGVPCGMGDEGFVVTAAHVLDELKDQQIVTLGEEGLIRFPFRADQYGFSPQASVDADVGVVHLPKEAVVQMGRRFRFSGPADVQPLTAITAQNDRIVYCLIGYPHTKNRSPRRSSKFMMGRTYYWLTSQLQNVDEAKWIGKRNKVHFALARTKRERHFRLPHFDPPAPQGVSGGGIWAISVDRKTGALVQNPKLVGIGIEYRSKERMFVGTRIEYALALLVDLYKEVVAAQAK